MKNNRPIELTIADIVQPRPTDWHSTGCACELCQPRHPADDRRGLTANQISLIVLAGLATGEAISFMIDKIVDGPGILAIFGL